MSISHLGSTSSSYKYGQEAGGIELPHLITSSTSHPHHNQKLEHKELKDK